MDPTMPTRPKHWRKFGRLSLFLLVAALVSATGGWAASNLGLDASRAYRLAALFGAGAMLFGLMFLGSAGMSGAADDHSE